MKTNFGLICLTRIAWHSTLIEIQFPATEYKKKRNSTKKPTTGASCQALIKDETSIFRPTFRINTENDQGTIAGSNIFRIPEVFCPRLSRWYWITDVVHITTCVYDIHCETDVLATYQDDIKNTEAYVEYSASAGTPFMQDNRFPRTFANNHYSNTLTVDDFSATGTFILQVASSSADGSGGLLNLYACSPAELSAIANRLYSADLIEKITDTFTNPTDALGCCTWIPVDKSKISSGSASIVFNNVTIGTGSIAIKHKTARIGKIKPIQLHKSRYIDANGNVVESWADYRNLPPYTQYYIYLPGAGIVEYPAQELFDDGSHEPECTIDYDLSVPTGDIIYTINRTNGSHPGDLQYQDSVMTIAGNIGANVPTSAYQSGFGKAISSAIATGAAMATMFMAPLSEPYMIGTAVNTAASAVMNIGRSSMSASGSLGSFAIANPKALLVSVSRIQYETSDTPYAARESCGMPLFAHKKLSDLSGYVKCNNAHVLCSGSADEQDLLNRFLNGQGVYLEYG